MPIYDFKCQHCGHVQEKLVKSRYTPISCSECNGHCDPQLSAGYFRWTVKGYAPGKVELNIGRDDDAVD